MPGQGSFNRRQCSVSTIIGVLLVALVASCGSSDGQSEQAAAPTEAAPTSSADINTDPEPVGEKSSPTEDDQDEAAAPEAGSEPGFTVAYNDLAAGVEITATDPESLAVRVVMFAVPDTVDLAAIGDSFASDRFVVATPWEGYDIALLYEDVFCGIAPEVSLTTDPDSGGLVLAVDQLEVDDCEAAGFHGGIGVELVDGDTGQRVVGSYTPHVTTGV